MRSIKASEFKAKCLAIIDEVHDTGEPVLILKHGRAVARLVPPAGGAGAHPQGRTYKARSPSLAICSAPFSTPMLGRSRRARSPEAPPRHPHSSVVDRRSGAPLGRAKHRHRRRKGGSAALGVGHHLLGDRHPGPAPPHPARPPPSRRAGEGRRATPRAPARHHSRPRRFPSLSYAIFPPRPRRPHPGRFTPRPSGRPS